MSEETKSERPGVWIGDRIIFSVALLQGWLAEPGQQSEVLRLARVRREGTAVVLEVERETHER